MIWQIILRRIGKEANHLYGAYNSWQRDDGALMAAAVAYYVGLSLFPLLLVLISGLGLFLQYSHLGQNAEEQVLAMLAEQLSPSMSNNLADALTHVKDRSAVTGPIGLIGVFLAAIAGFAQFERAFDRIWNVSAPTSQGILHGLRLILVQRGTAFLMLLGMGMLVVTVFLAGMALSAVESTTEDVLPAPDIFWRLAQTGMTLTLNTLMFTLLYRWLPKVPVRWREAMRGATVAAVAWEIGRQILASVLVGNRYTSAYGVIGSFIAIQLWCYYAVAVVFYGAEYIQEFCRWCRKNPLSDQD